MSNEKIPKNPFRRAIRRNLLVLFVPLNQYIQHIALLFSMPLIEPNKKVYTLSHYPTLSLILNSLIGEIIVSEWLSVKWMRSLWKSRAINFQSTVLSMDIFFFNRKFLLLNVNLRNCICNFIRKITAKWVIHKLYFNV